MSFSFRPAIREHTPMIIGLAGPSKSGKTFSALRLAIGLSNGGKIAMINTEGKRGNQYADKFQYLVTDLSEPFSMKRYEEAIKAAGSINPTVIIIDSISHAHEGIGGMLDQHEKELDRLAGTDYKKRERMTWAAWVKPKQDEATMINSMLQMGCHIILCFRAKEKIKIIKGQEPIDLGWKPIASDRIHFETAFTLILPPHSEGIPDIEASEFRTPYDTIIKAKQLNEDMGKRLSEWASGGVKAEKAEIIDMTTGELITHPESGFPSTEEEQAMLEKKGMAEPEGKKWQPILDEISKFSEIQPLKDWANRNLTAWKKEYPDGLQEIRNSVSERIASI